MTRTVRVRIIESVYYDVDVAIPDERTAAAYLDGLERADRLGDLVDPTKGNVTERFWESLPETTP
jgi:hypothetical protein